MTANLPLFSADSRRMVSILLVFPSAHKEGESQTEVGRRLSKPRKIRDTGGPDSMNFIPDLE
jgi:hypothetical protein